MTHYPAVSFVYISGHLCHSGRMSQRPPTISFRPSQDERDALEQIARAERRTISNVVARFVAEKIATYPDLKSKEKEQ